MTPSARTKQHQLHSKKRRATRRVRLARPRAAFRRARQTPGNRRSCIRVHGSCRDVARRWRNGTILASLGPAKPSSRRRHPSPPRAVSSPSRKIVPPLELAGIYCRTSSTATEADTTRRNDKSSAAGSTDEIGSIPVPPLTQRYRIWTGYRIRPTTAYDRRTG